MAAPLPAPVPLPVPGAPIAGVAPDATGGNFWRDDPALAELLGLRMAPDLLAHLAAHLARLGALAGGELDALARAIDANPPVLEPRDRYGRDDFRIRHHPAHAAAEALLVDAFALHAMGQQGGVLGWPEPLPPLAKFAFRYLAATAECSLLGPIATTEALARVLDRFAAPALLQTWLPYLTGRHPGARATGALFLTETAAGSDPGAIATTARLQDGVWRLSGAKWFCSNADCDVALVLARVATAPDSRELGLFLMPRRLADGTPNRWRIVRLKPQLGRRGLATGEAVLEGAIAEPVGDLARGRAQLGEAIDLLRLSNGAEAAGLMRRALIEARAAACGRAACGRAVIDFPAQRRQLLKLMLPTEQALSFLLWAATLAGKADAGDAEAARLVRLAAALLNFRACRDARKVAGDAMEVRGGNGCIEEFVEPRLLRDAHPGSIREGTSNLVAAAAIGDAVGRDRAAEPFAEALIAELASAPLSAAAPAAEALRRAVAFAEDSAEEPVLHRQAASALYRAASACLFVAEGAALTAAGGDARRMLLARLALDHQLSARDPMARGDTVVQTAIADALLGEEAMPADAVLGLM